MSALTSEKDDFLLQFDAICSWHDGGWQRQKEIEIIGIGGRHFWSRDQNRSLFIIFLNDFLTVWVACWIRHVFHNTLLKNHFRKMTINRVGFRVPPKILLFTRATFQRPFSLMIKFFYGDWNCSADSSDITKRAPKVGFRKFPFTEPDMELSKWTLGWQLVGRPTFQTAFSLLFSCNN